MYRSLVRDFLVAVGNGERELEEARQGLSNIAAYNPAALFAVIDTDGDGNIEADELHKFLQSTGEHGISETELQVLIDFFDSDNNGRLNVNEFSYLVLPCENNELRQQVQERGGELEKKDGKIDVDIENGLVRIIAREIELQRQLEDIKR